LKRVCYICGEEFKDKEMVELTVIAPYNDIPSRIAFSIGKPVEAYLDTLRHNVCPDYDGYTI